MMPVYEHDFGGGDVLNVYPISVNTDLDSIESLIRSMDGQAQPHQADIQVVASLDDFADLEVNLSGEWKEEGDYETPAQLKVAREMLEESFIGKTNGHVMLLDGEMTHPLNIRHGRYFDWMATKPTEAFLQVTEEEVTLASLGVLLPELNLTYNDLARYVGFCYIMKPENGDELLLVHRAKGMGIAADCMSFPGSTIQMTPEFYTPNFDFVDAFVEHIKERMWGEFKLEPHELEANRTYLVDDKTGTPFIAVEIVTSLSSHDIAVRTYGSTDPRKEASLLYGIVKEDAKQLTDRMPMFYSAQMILQDLV